MPQGGATQETLFCSLRDLEGMSFREELYASLEDKAGANYPPFGKLTPCSKMHSPTMRHARIADSVSH